MQFDRLKRREFVMLLNPALGPKWMGILKEIAPAVRRVAFVHVPEIGANIAFMRAGEASAAALE
jgi:hypothetical protein